MAYRIPTTAREKLNEAAVLLRQGPLLVWAVFLFMFPFYFFDSGLPQPWGFLILLLLPNLLSGWNGRLLDMTRPFKALLMFVGYATVINLTWSFALMTFAINLKDGLILSPLFYIYNALVLFTFILMYQKYRVRLLWLTAHVCFASVWTLVLVSFFVRMNTLRSSLSFNNPNQLGYFALLSACILLLTMRRLRLGTVFVTLGLIACSYLALISASKAALGSIALLGISLLITRMRTMLIAIAVLAVLALTPNPFSHAIERAEQRIATDNSHSLLEERGYDRILNHPEHWLFGSGEGNYRRFQETTVIGAHELHSSGATIFFCYGIIGVVLFGLFMWLVIKGSTPRAYLIVLPGFAYGMTHQGLRFIFMWVMLGVVMAIRHDESEQRRLAQRASAPS
jgi:hypothetical protein